MFLKIHRLPDVGYVVAVCDRELINTTIMDGEAEIKITESFYGNRCVTEDEVVSALRAAENANIIGERAIGLAIRHGIIAEENCILLGTVPHALVFRL